MFETLFLLFFLLQVVGTKRREPVGSEATGEALSQSRVPTVLSDSWVITWP